MTEMRADGSEPDDPPGSFLSRIFRGSRDYIVEQKLSREGYTSYRRLLMRARPEVRNGILIVNLPEGRIELRPRRLVVRARTRAEAERILRNLHHYSQPPSLWPAYGLSYSIKAGRKLGAM